MSEQIYSLPVIETVKAAWERVSGSKGTLWAVIGTVMGVLFCIGFVMGWFAPLNKSVEGLINFIAQIIQILGAWAVMYLGIQRALDRPIKYAMAKTVLNFWLFLKMIGVYALSIIVIMPAIILMIIGVVIFQISPDANLYFVAQLSAWLIFLLAAIVTIYLGMRLYVAKGLVLDQKMNPWRAVKTSFRATKSNVWPLFGLVVLNVIILFVSMIPLGIGLIWSLPYLFINYGMVYRRLVIERQM